MGLLSLIIKFGADITGFKAGTKEIDSNVGALANNIGGKLAAAFSTAAITAFIFKIQQSVHEVSLLAKQFALTEEEIQKITKAYRKQDLEFSDFAASLKTFETYREKAKEDRMGEEFGFLKSLGFSGYEVADEADQEVTAYDMMRRIGKRGGVGTLTAEQRAEAYKAFGKKSPKQLQALGMIGEQAAVYTNEQAREMESFNRAERGITKEIYEGGVKGWADVVHTLLTGRPALGKEYGLSNLAGLGQMDVLRNKGQDLSDFQNRSLDYQKRTAESVDAIKKTIGE